MPTFLYRAYGPQGELAEGRIEAPSEKAVAELLSVRRLVPFEVGPAEASAEPWWRRDISFSKQSLSQAELAWFTREMATLAAAGIPLAETLQIAAEQASPGRARSSVELLLGEVLDGSSLSDAMQKRSNDFPPDYVNVVRAGEASGALSDAMTELATLLEQRVEMRGRIQSALVYPAILMVLSLASLVLIVGVLVPNIAPIFREGGKEIPGAIGFLMLLHDRWAEMLLGLLAVAGFIALGVAFAWRRPAIRLATDGFMLRLPLIGPFLLKQDTARYARTLGTLLKAGVPLLLAASSASALVKNRAIAAGVGASIERLREGSSLHGAISGNTALPNLALRMIAIGERSARLGEMLLRVAVIFEQQTQRGLDRFMAVFTPAVTLMIAVLVGGLIVTIMNAILSLNDLAIQ